MVLRIGGRREQKMESRKGALKDFVQFGPMLVSFLAVFVIWSFNADATFALYNGVHPLKFLHFFCTKYAVHFMIWLVLIPRTHSSWRSLFGFKVWFLPSVLLVSGAMLFWRGDPVLNYGTLLILGYSWQWCAIATWITLFITNLYFFEKHGLDKVDGFVFSFLNVLLASAAYEVPTFSFSWVTLVNPPIILYVILWVYLFIRYNMKASPKLPYLLICSLPIILGWIFYFRLPYELYWIPRLTTYPFFMFIPFLVKKNSDFALIQKA